MQRTSPSYLLDAFSIFAASWLSHGWYPVLNFKNFYRYTSYMGSESWNRCRSCLRSDGGNASYTFDIIHAAAADDGRYRTASFMTPHGELPVVHPSCGRTRWMKTRALYGVAAEAIKLTAAS